MSWPRFVLSNFLGAISCFAVVSLLGYSFGNRLPWLINLLRTSGVVLLGLSLAAAGTAWRFYNTSGRPLDSHKKEHPDALGCPCLSYGASRFPKR